MRLSLRAQDGARRGLEFCARGLERHSRRLLIRRKLFERLARLGCATFYFKAGDVISRLGRRRLQLRRRAGSQRLR